MHYGETITTEGNCFEKVAITLEKESATKARLRVSGTGRRSALCSDFFMFANTEIVHVELMDLGGHYVIDLNIPGEDAQVDLEKRGLSSFLFCEAFQDELLSVFTTLKAFVGGLGLHGKTPLFQPKVPKYMEETNVEFLKWAANYTLVERPEATRKVHINEDDIKSGDYLAIARLDGLDPMIMYGTGSHSGHTTMALRFDGELYIVESQDAWYWPVLRIQRTPFSKWMEWAENCDFSVTYMPLSDEKRA